MRIGKHSIESELGDIMMEALEKFAQQAPLTPDQLMQEAERVGGARGKKVVDYIDLYNSLEDKEVLNHNSPKHDPKYDPMVPNASDFSEIIKGWVNDKPTKADMFIYTNIKELIRLAGLTGVFFEGASRLDINGLINMHRKAASQQRPRQ